MPSSCILCMLTAVSDVLGFKVIIFLLFLSDNVLFSIFLFYQFLFSDWLNICTYSIPIIFLWILLMKMFVFSLRLPINKNIHSWLIPLSKFNSYFHFSQRIQGPHNTLIPSFSPIHLPLVWCILIIRTDASQFMMGLCSNKSIVRWKYC